MIDPTAILQIPSDRDAVVQSTLLQFGDDLAGVYYQTEDAIGRALSLRELERHLPADFPIGYRLTVTCLAEEFETVHAALRLRNATSTPAAES